MGADEIRDELKLRFAETLFGRVELLFELIEIVEGMWCDIGYTWNGTDFGQPQ
mgnify:CR=1 FL=1